jgi:transposase-like protein
MDRPRHNPEQIVDLLREAQLRLEQGDSRASVCKSLGISPSSYRRWRMKYGERSKGNAIAIASNTSGQSAGDRPTPTDNAPELSKEAEKLLAAANDASGSARNTWLAFLALLAYLLVTLGA